MVEITRVCDGCGCKLTKPYTPKHYPIPNWCEFCETCALKIDNWVLEFKEECKT